MKFAVLDTVFTGITASTMWLTRGAKKKEMPGEVTLCDLPPATEIAGSNDNETGARTEFSGKVKPQETTHAQRVAYSPDAIVGQTV